MKFIFKWSILIILLFILVIGIINIYVVFSTNKKILNVEALEKVEVDCILVLGAAVWDGEPSPILKDRLLKAIELYNSGVSNKIIVSGDNVSYNYDEVNVMRKFLLDNGIPTDDILMDNAGISTYDSMYRAKNIFNIKKMVVVTQRYHLYRSLNICDILGIEAYGFASDIRKYRGSVYREGREVLARFKDFFKSSFNVKAVYLDNNK